VKGKEAFSFLATKNSYTFQTTITPYTKATAHPKTNEPKNLRRKRNDCKG
jgi:hypothetical protein